MSSELESLTLRLLCQMLAKVDQLDCKIDEMAEDVREIRASLERQIARPARLFTDGVVGED